MIRMFFNGALRNIGNISRNIGLILIMPNTMTLLRKCWAVVESPVAIASINASIVVMVFAGYVSAVKAPSVYRVQGVIRRMWFMWSVGHFIQE